MAYIQGESRSQTSLFPVSLEELIPESSTCMSPSSIWASSVLRKLSPRPLGALLTTPPISSSSISMAIFSAFARRGA